VVVELLEVGALKTKNTEYLTEGGCFNKSLGIAMECRADLGLVICCMLFVDLQWLESPVFSIISERDC